MDFTQYLAAGDWVSKGLFAILILLSLVSWVTGILRLVASSRLANTIPQKLNTLIDNHSTAVAGLDFAQKRVITEQLLLQSIARCRYEADKGLGILGTTASIAPFIGLFGTVWGIFHALHSIGQTGQAGLAQVAGPVGEALIMTALGLAVAIPAVVFYNLITRLNKKAMHYANDTAHAILAKTAV